MIQRISEFCNGFKYLITMRTDQRNLENTLFIGESCFLRSLISEREKEVLKLISQGDTTIDIAASLYISTHTVISHRKNLLEKLAARNAAHLVLKSVRLGLL